MHFRPPLRLLSNSSLPNRLSTRPISILNLSHPSNPFPLTNTNTNNSVHNSTNPHRNNFLQFIRLCQRVEDLKPLKSLLIVYGLIRHETTLVGEFLRLCFHLGVPSMALSTFERIENPSGLLQNLMIRCLCDDGLFENVLYMYQNCRVLGCISDNFTFPFVIKACSALGALHIGKEIHCVVLRTGFGDNLVIQTSLVDFYSKNGELGKARLVLDRITEPDLVSWNALISGYSSNGLNHEAFEVFREIFVVGLKPNVSTLATVIPICTRLKSLDLGKSIHGFALKSGYFMDDYLMPALISLYAGGGDLPVARGMFDCILKKNVTIWNAMVSAYTQDKKTDDAFELFKDMLHDNVQPNMVTFVSFIPSCENFDSLLYGETLHACVIKYGLENQISVMTALLSMYSNFGDLSSAKFLFDQMPRRNLLSWNSMVSAYVHNGLWDASLDSFCEMQVEGFNPDAVSIICVLSACTELEAVLFGKSAHGFSLKKGFDSNLTLTNALLKFYSKCVELSLCFKLFPKMDIRNTISWNTLISGCVHNGESKIAVSLLNQMQKEGIDLDLVTLISVLPSYNKSENLIQGIAIHGYAMKMGFSSDVALANALISMYCNCGDLDLAKSLFEAMPNKSVVSWNAIITCYRYNNLSDEVIMLFQKMIKEDIKPNYITLLNLLPECQSQLQGKSVHAYAVKTRIVLEAPLLTSLIFMYARFEIINWCLLLFELGEKRNISLWNAIISVHVQIKEVKQAIAFFCDMLRMNIEPDYVTVLSLVSACVEQNNLNLANSVMGFLIQKGFEKDAAINNAFIDLYAKCGKISISKKIFEGLVEKDHISWSVMINAHGLHGDGEAALALFSLMKLSGLKPDDITFISILSACSHGGLVEQGRTIFNSMVEYGLSPRIEHYACMVDLLGRMGHLDEAYGIVEKLPFKPSLSLLESLLGACITHGNVELGEKVGRFLLEMDPENSGPYVMIYNVYAAAGRWTEANRVRSNMEERELKKIPGFSIVEGNRNFEG